MDLIISYIELFFACRYTEIMDIPLSAYLMMDLRGYTKFLMHEDLKNVLSNVHTYYTEFDKCVERGGGVFCSVLGDAVGAVFHGEGCADRALRAAGETLERLREIEFRFKANAGIDVGQVIVDGYKYSKAEFIYPVGKPVVIAYRLEDLAADVGSDVLITETTLGKLSEKFKKKFISVGAFPIKGVDGNINVWGAQASALITA